MYFFDPNKRQKEISNSILKSFGVNTINLKKAYEEGVYADTPYNRKLGRVGKPYDYLQNAPKKEQKEDKKESSEFKFNKDSLGKDGEYLEYLKEALTETTKTATPEDIKPGVWLEHNGGLRRVNKVVDRDDKKVAFLENMDILDMGEDEKEIYLTGESEFSLSRTHSLNKMRVIKSSYHGRLNVIHKTIQNLKK